MHEGKIKNFMHHYRDREFPWYRELNPTECRGIREHLIERFKISAPVDDLLEFTIQLDDLTEWVSDANAEADDFSVRVLMEYLKIEQQSGIYINWYLFEVIDKMHFEDFDGYFDDIWYPAADNVDIFDDTFLWLLSIDHHGYVKLTRP